MLAPLIFTQASAQREQLLTANRHCLIPGEASL